MEIVMRNPHLFSLALVAASVSFPLAASAAEQDLLGLSLEQLMDVKIKKVYSASKFEQKVTQAPSAVSIVSADDIARYGYRTLADILRSVRGFYTFSDGKYDYIGVRGFGRLGDFNDRILVLVDGHRINDSVYDYAPIGTDFPLDVDLIRRVEIVRGPGSSLYGTNAFFAVVNIITKSGKDYEASEWSVAAGNYGQRQGRATLGNTFDNGMDMLLSASVFADAGRTRLYFPEYDDPATNNGVAENLDDYSATKLFLKLSHGDFALQAGYGRRVRAFPTADYFTVFNDPNAEVVDRQYYLDLKNRWVLGNDAELLARVYHDDYRFDGIYPYDYGIGYTVLNRQYSRNHGWGGELQYSATLGARQRLVMGAEYRHAAEQKILNHDEFGVYVDVEKSPSENALYVQDEIKLSPQWLLNAGLRRDGYESFGSHLSPRLSLIYQPAEQTSVKLLYGEAFRAPSTFELYYDDGIAQKGNPDLGPEIIRTYELALDHYVSPETRLAASLFRYRISDLIGLETDPTDGLLVYRNAHGAKAYGLELEAEQHWSEQLTARFSYSYQSAKDSASDTRLGNSPTRMAKLNLSAPLIGGWGIAGIELQCLGSRLTRLDSRVGGYCLTNVTLLKQAPTRGLSTSVSIYNLFDKEYADPVSDSHLMETLQQKGRRFWLKLVYRL
jgi:outer membrane receptor for ferrienterochelin and colicins